MSLSRDSRRFTIVAFVASALFVSAVLFLIGHGMLSAYGQRLLIETLMAVSVFAGIATIIASRRRLPIGLISTIGVSMVVSLIVGYMTLIHH